MKQNNHEVIVFGASGHAKVVIDLLENQEEGKVKYLVDDNPVLKGQTFFGYKVAGGKGEVNPLGCNRCLIAIGDNLIRNGIASWAEDNGFVLAEAAIHPSAQLARGVAVGAGTVLMAGVVVNSDTVIGKNSIINTGATVDHDCKIGDTVHIAPGSTVCGGVSVGDLTFIGAGAVIHPNIKVGKNVTVGAGSTVLKDVPDGISVVGTPAEEIA